MKTQPEFVPDPTTGGHRLVGDLKRQEVTIIRGSAGYTVFDDKDTKMSGTFATLDGAIMALRGIMEL